MNDEVPYERLTPDVIIAAVERCGFECTGSILALASYENRVYQIGTADGFVVVKFYRPGRWSTAAILEEHEFALELAGQERAVTERDAALEQLFLHQRGLDQLRQRARGDPVAFEEVAKHGRVKHQPIQAAPAVAAGADAQRALLAREGGGRCQSRL